MALYGPKQVALYDRNSQITKNDDYDKETIICKWFKNNEIKQDQFPIDTLKIVEDSE